MLVWVGGGCWLHLEGLGPDDQGEQLVSQADPQHRLGLLHTHHLPHVLYGGLAELGVSGPVADEQPVKIYNGLKHGRWGKGGGADNHGALPVHLRAVPHVMTSSTGLQTNFFPHFFHQILGAHTVNQHANQIFPFLQIFTVLLIHILIIDAEMTMCCFKFIVTFYCDSHLSQRPVLITLGQ